MNNGPAIPMNPYRYFKYRVINKNLIDSLVNGSIYFAPPLQLNDPFDCQISLKKSALHAAPNVSGVKRDNLLKLADFHDPTFDLIQQSLKEIGVCAFSLSMIEPVLWSHYANEHRGICLLYEFTEDFLSDEENEFIAVCRIDYGDNPLSDWLIKNIPMRVTDGFEKKFLIELVIRMLEVKSISWEKEKESRIIREKAGLYPIPKGCLKQVCFGLRTPNSDIKLIKKIIDSSGYNVTYCRIIRGESDFGIKAVEI